MTFKEKDASGKSKAVTISRKDGTNFQKEGTLLQKARFCIRKNAVEINLQRFLFTQNSDTLHNDISTGDISFAFSSIFTYYSKLLNA